MSGLEVAGLVLGAVPIIVEALKAYNEARRLVQRFRSKTEHIRILMGDLAYYRFSINEQVFKVLSRSGIVVTEDDLRSGKGADILKDPLQSHKVSKYLGAERFGIFVAQLKHCQSVVVAILKQFEGLVPSVDRTSESLSESETLQRLILANKLSEGSPWQLSGKKLKFMYSKTELDAKMLRLREATAQLRDPDLQSANQFVFVESAQGDVSIRALRSLTRSFEVTQLRATWLYSALANVLARPCHHRHVVRLFLEERTDSLRRNKAPAQTFSIEILGLSSTGTIELCHTCIIPTIEDDDFDAHKSTGQNTPSVSFAVGSATKAYERVETFCLCLESASSNRRSISFVLSSNGSLGYLEAQAGEIVPSYTSNDAVSLEDVIRRASDRARPERRWRLRQRMKLALQISATILQLNRTQWLSSEYTAASIHFRTIDNLSVLQVPFEADRPFMATSDLVYRRDAGSAFATHSIILDLGILLMELWSIQTFKDWCALTQNNMPQTYEQRHQLADSWLIELEPGMLPNYKRAVRRCIECSTRTANSFEHEDFREDFCEGIIKPLWENCKGL